MFEIEVHLSKHGKKKINLIIDYNILSDQPAQFSKKNIQIQIIKNIHYPL